MNADPQNKQALTARTFTAVPVRRLRIRHLAQGSGCLEFDGPNQRINHAGPTAVDIQFTGTQRFRYALNLWRSRLRFGPLSALAQLCSGAALICNAAASRMPSARTTARLIPKAIALAVITLLSLAGVSRFVHVDLRTIAGSVHFGLPHFLTPWRPVEDNPPPEVAANAPSSNTGFGALFSLSQYSLLAPQATPAASAPAAPTSSPEPTNYVPSYYRKSPNSYLPMPSGPLPAGMATATYVPSIPSRSAGAVSLDVHPAFTEPDDDTPHDEVVLMTSNAAGADSGARESSHESVTLLGERTDAVKAANQKRSEPHAAAASKDDDDAPRTERKTRASHEPISKTPTQSDRSPTPDHGSHDDNDAVVLRNKSDSAPASYQRKAKTTDKHDEQRAARPDAHSSRVTEPKTTRTVDSHNSRPADVHATTRPTAADTHSNHTPEARPSRPVETQKTHTQDQPRTPDQAPQRQTAQSTSGLVLLQRKAPSDQQDAATSTIAAPGNAGEQSDPSGAVSLAVHPGQPTSAPPPTPTGPRRPSYSVVTHTDDSLVVRVDGQMKQIPIGQSLPDGSKLLSVERNGGGFHTTRGNFAAY